MLAGCRAGQGAGLCQHCRALQEAAAQLGQAGSCSLLSSLLPSFIVAWLLIHVSSAQKCWIRPSGALTTEQRCPRQEVLCQCDFGASQLCPGAVSPSCVHLPELFASLCPPCAALIQLLLSQGVMLSGAKFLAITDWVVSILEPSAAPRSSACCHFPALPWPWAMLLPARAPPCASPKGALGTPGCE